MGEILARLGEGLRTGQSKQIGLVYQMRENALSSFWTLALKPDSIATISTGKVSKRWRRKALGLSRELARSSSE